MTKPYSEDLRTRIVRAVTEEGMSQPQVAARFAVSLPSVKRYLRQLRASGTLTPRAAPGRAPTPGGDRHHGTDLLPAPRAWQRGPNVHLR